MPIKTDRNFDRDNFQEWIDMAISSAREVMRDLESAHNELLSAVRTSNLKTGTRLVKRTQAVADTVTAVQLMANRLGADIAALGLVSKSTVALESVSDKAPLSADRGNHTPHPTPSNGADATSTASAPLGV